MGNDMSNDMGSPIVKALKQSMEVLTSMNTAQWYTPPWFLERVRQVFGSDIDLDPASDPIANQMVMANRYYTPREHDGLRTSWKAENIFLNPPYSVEGLRVAATSVWVNLALSEYQAGNYKEGILLVNAKLGYKWFNNLLDHKDTYTILLRDRIAFIHPETMEPSKPSRQPQAVIYLGPNYINFSRVFSDLGWKIR